MENSTQPEPEGEPGTASGQTPMPELDKAMASQQLAKKYANRKKHANSTAKPCFRFRLFAGRNALRMCGLSSIFKMDDSEDAAKKAALARKQALFLHRQALLGREQRIKGHLPLANSAEALIFDPPSGVRRECLITSNSFDAPMRVPLSCRLKEVDSNQVLSSSWCGELRSRKPNPCHTFAALCPGFRVEAADDEALDEIAEEKLKLKNHKKRQQNSFKQETEAFAWLRDAVGSVKEKAAEQGKGKGKGKGKGAPAPPPPKGGMAKPKTMIPERRSSHSKKVDGMPNFFWVRLRWDGEDPEAANLIGNDMAPKPNAWRVCQPSDDSIWSRVRAALPGDENATGSNDRPDLVDTITRRFIPFAAKQSTAEADELAALENTDGDDGRVLLWEPVFRKVGDQISKALPPKTAEERRTQLTLAIRAVRKKDMFFICFESLDLHGLLEGETLLFTYTMEEHVDTPLEDKLEEVRIQLGMSEDAWQGRVVIKAQQTSGNPFPVQVRLRDIADVGGDNGGSFGRVAPRVSADDLETIMECLKEFSELDRERLLEDDAPSKYVWDPAPEAFFRRFLQTPFCDLRLECWTISIRYMRLLDPTMDRSLRQMVQQVRDRAQAIMKSDVFPRILQLILIAGNTLNAGHSLIEHADGFEVYDAIVELLNKFPKDNQGRPLLEFIAQHPEVVAMRVDIRKELLGVLGSCALDDGTDFQLLLKESRQINDGIKSFLDQVKRTVTPETSSLEEDTQCGFEAVQAFVTAHLEPLGAAAEELLKECGECEVELLRLQRYLGMKTQEKAPRYTHPKCIGTNMYRFPGSVFGSLAEFSRKLVEGKV